MIPSHFRQRSLHTYSPKGGVKHLVLNKVIIMSSTKSTAALTTTTTTTTTKSSPSKATKTEKPVEYNPRWQGYVYISLCSLVNFASISNIKQGSRSWVASIVFGVFSFAVSTMVLIQDRSQKCLTPLHYTKARDGYLEGYTLSFMALWWIVG